MIIPAALTVATGTIVVGMDAKIASVGAGLISNMVPDTAVADIVASTAANTVLQQGAAVLTDAVVDKVVIVNPEDVP